MFGPMYVSVENSLLYEVLASHAYAIKAPLIVIKLLYFFSVGYSSGVYGTTSQCQSEYATHHASVIVKNITSSWITNWKI